VTTIGSVWAEFGFNQNPYATVPIPPTDLGESLLVGRDQEVLDLVARITATTSIPVLVGANGVGKTSIVSVATHRLQKGSAGRRPRYLSLYPPLQLPLSGDHQAFERLAYYRIAGVLLENTKFLRDCGVKRGDIKRLGNWLRNPAESQRGGGISTPVVGVTVQSGSTPSGSDGFMNAGMQMMVSDWLDLCFHDSENGGIICVIDNLEILKTSGRARASIESLRDGLFAKNGLRWVLCGTPAVAGGGALFSARMEGRIAPPIEIQPVPSGYASELISRRLQHYGSVGSYSPVDEMGFQHIYSIVNSRLRSALDLCQEYAIYLYGQERRPGESERVAVLDRWLAAQAASYSLGAGGVEARSWRLFDGLTDLGGEVRGAEAEILRFASPADLAAGAVSLISAGLIEKVDLDGGDFLLGVTTPGWLVRFQRRNWVA
jgi:hypothetical protein